MIARVVGKLIRFPWPYAPPDQPVLTIQQSDLCFCIRSASIWAYLAGCQTRKGEPKQAENVVCGSVIPISVPATFAVYPLMKWYIACSGVRRLTGGNTPKASHVRKMMFDG